MRKAAATFVLTLRLKGGLNHVIFLFQFRFLFFCAGCPMYSIPSAYPLANNALLYIGAASLNASSLDELVDTRRLIPAGSCFIMDGGWFE